MSLRLFEGPAGSGKTTRLFEELAATLETRPLAEYQRILAMTKMHGSRRRMQGRLSALPGLKGRFECTTVDSFAWRILRRWRGLARAAGNEIPTANDFREVCRCAGTLLCKTAVRNWTTCAFPVFIIDEMQDSKEGQLEMVRALAESAVCLAAADDFQDLDSSGDNAAVVWAQQTGEVVTLTQNHRTSATGLLAAANALRSNQAVPAAGSGFKVLGANNANVGASFLSKSLTWWRNSDDIAIITPVRAENSTFVRDLIGRVQRGPIGNPAFGPHHIPWEASQEDECEQFLSGLGLPSEPSAELRASNICMHSQSASAKTLSAWLDQQRRLAGRTTFTVREICHQARAIYQNSRAYRRVRDRGLRAMTVHQAKNREFDSVIVLWPYEVSAARQRRLLYNAITRAKRQAVVIVQNPNRLNEPPFVADEIATQPVGLG
jgi:superfamily I DNA/RNA helicase